MRTLSLLALFTLACDGGDDDTAAETSEDTAVADLGAPDAGRPDAGPAQFRVVTFNTGSGPELAHDRGPDDGYSSEHAALTDTWYGNGLAWRPLIEDTRAYLAEVDADLLAFQEIFHPGECVGVPPEAREGFVCETWMPGDETVVQQIIAADYQVACHPGKPDKCLAVHARFGRFGGCADALCLEGLEGGPVVGCGRGARVARGVVERVDGTRITVVSVHGTSGFTAGDQACRRGQVAQVFDDFDGAPLANGTANIVLGDLNTDPARFTFDASAADWLAAEAAGFHFVSAVGPDATPTYANFNIDHVLSDTFTGECWSGGVDGRPAVSTTVFFDHRPLVCDLTTR